MRRSTTFTTKTEEEGSDYLSTSLHESNNAFPDNDASPFFMKNESQISEESDCLSDSSRKIRKKRNAYSKISDDIRMDLLECVKNGETLKSAAKRHKINYSSAKSILHTYRKEGRILKKSAQERTNKKKTTIPFEDEEDPKPPKLSKKQSVQSTRTVKSRTSIMNETKCETMSNQCSEDNSPLSSVAGLNENFMSLLSMNNHAKPLEGNHTSNSQSQSLSTIESRKASIHERDHVSLRPVGDYYRKMSHNEDASKHEAKDLNSMFGNYSESNFFGNGFPEYPSYMNNSNEFEALNELPPWNGRKFSEDMYQDPNSFLNFKAFNASEDKSQKFDFGMDFENHKGESLECPLRSFMDTQNLFRRALRKASIVSYSGSASGYRKGSMDLF